MHRYYIVIHDGLLFSGSPIAVATSGVQRRFFAAFAYGGDFATIIPLATFNHQSIIGFLLFVVINNLTYSDDFLTTAIVSRTFRITSDMRQT